MCLAFPGKIKKITGQNAIVDFDGIEKEINISLVGDVKIGEFVIVHAGFAIEKVDEVAVGEIDKLLNS
ncbi:MAG: HypC/HybG/HupF family hydrogenase formation chaperone [Candidatus Moranbacteria bacterium]|jgi:hydrogenase expression/formation protein HypC|nr:HypC/HybG/HupF family hydrogenase formation chaperone [Candidatus Moranbacteria bacterium]